MLGGITPKVGSARCLGTGVDQLSTTFTNQNNAGATIMAQVVTPITSSDAVVFIATAWGSKHGGINAFNMDLACAMARNVDVPVFCFAAQPDILDIEAAAHANVTLLPIPNDCADGVHPSVAKLLVDTLDHAAPSIRRPCWVGHDLISGHVMLSCHKFRPGTSLLIQHMDYESYEGLKNGHGATAIAKASKQIELVEHSMVVAGVGPKLAALARARVEGQERKQVLELIPGLATIEAATPPASFSAIAFGRFDKRMEPIKQSRLAVAGFARAIRDGTHTMGHDPKLTLLGLDQNTTVLSELRALAFKEAERAVVINAASFSEDRDYVFGLLRRQSAALMLSFHEGFGLVGWEAIAAGVPLVLSQNSGLFELLEARMLENRVFSVDVRGGASPQELNPDDISAVAGQLLTIARAPRKARERAQSLTRELSSVFTWRRCAEQVGTAASVPISRVPFRLLCACGFPALDIFGPSDIVEGERSRVQCDARQLWEKAASEIARCLSLGPRKWQVLFPGVDGGTFAAVVVREFVEKYHRESDVITVTHSAFTNDDQAQKYLQQKNPEYNRTHNVDPHRPYLYLPGTVSRVPGIEDRREILVARADAVLCVSGQAPVGHMIGLAIARRLPIIAIGAFGGRTAERLKEILEHNASLSLTADLQHALRELACAPLRDDVLLPAIKRALTIIENISDYRDAPL
jgi:glycosyltransferase involved in cell wall biosynthesis